jgi:hypothetical protein
MKICTLTITTVGHNPNHRRHTSDHRLSELNTKVKLVPGASVHQQKEAYIIVREAGDNMLHFINEGVGSDLHLEGVKSISVNGNSIEIEVKPGTDWEPIETALAKMIKESFEFDMVELNNTLLAAA